MLLTDEDFSALEKLVERREECGVKQEYPFLFRNTDFQCYRQLVGLTECDQGSSLHESKFYFIHQVEKVPCNCL